MTAQRRPAPGLGPALQAAVAYAMREASGEPGAAFVALCALVAQVRTPAGEVYPGQLVGPQFRRVGVTPESLVPIVAEFEAIGFLRRQGEARFFLRSDLAAEILAARREELRERLRLLEGGKRGAPQGP